MNSLVLKQRFHDNNSLACIHISVVCHSAHAIMNAYKLLTMTDAISMLSRVPPVILLEDNIGLVKFTFATTYTEKTSSKKFSEHTYTCRMIILISRAMKIS